MSQQLFEHIAAYVKIPAKDLQEITPFFLSQNLGKKEIISEADQKCDYNHFVIKGCAQ